MLASGLVTYAIIIKVMDKTTERTHSQSKKCQTNKIAYQVDASQTGQNDLVCLELLVMIFYLEYMDCYLDWHN